MVMKTDSGKPRCPSVKVVFDPEKKKLVDPPMIQVAEGQGLSITAVLTGDEAKEVKEQA